MLFFELIQVALGRRERLSMTPSESEWHHLFHLSLQHTLTGVCYEGVIRLPREQWPDEALLTDWVWQVQRVKEQNELISQRSFDACQMLEAEGFNACLLKGQGLGLLYGPMAASRLPGDVDIWVTPRPDSFRSPRKRLISHVQMHFPEARLRYHHIAYPAMVDAEVELHFQPVCMNNLWHNHKLKQWFRQQHDRQMTHRVAMADGMVNVPTQDFNRLYLLLHIYKHVFEEGLGLRQLMDYYFVLVSESETSTQEVRQQLEALSQMIRQLRLQTLAGGVMYVLTEVFGLPEESQICPPNREVGMMLLSEMMQSGSFGYFDTRYDKSEEKTAGIGAQLHRYLRKTRRNIAMSYYFPHEGVWEPFTHICHYLWRKLKLWRI